MGVQYVPEFSVLFTSPPTAAGKRAGGGKEEGRAWNVKQEDNYEWGDETKVKIREGNSNGYEQRIDN